MNKKLIITTSIILISVSILGFIYYNNSSKNNNENILDKNNQIELNTNTKNNKVLNFLSSISGLKANNIEVINNPVGLKGELIAPKESILNGVDYFLKNTENENMENLKIDTGKDYISVKVDYKVTKNITTPIEVKVIPTLDTNKNLVINIEEVKFLDLKLANWIIEIILNSFVKDWFPKNGKINVIFNKGNIVIDKNNFKGITLNRLLIESRGLKIDAIIDLENIIDSNE